MTAVVQAPPPRTVDPLPPRTCGGDEGLGNRGPQYCHSPQRCSRWPSHCTHKAAGSFVACVSERTQRARSSMLYFFGGKNCVLGKATRCQATMQQDPGVVCGMDSDRPAQNHQQQYRPEVYDVRCSTALKKHNYYGIYIAGMTFKRPLYFSPCISLFHGRVGL